MLSVSIDDLRFTWPGARHPTLSIDAFELARGERVFLRGPSGSGKSTLLSAIAGVTDIAHGTVNVAGTDVGALRGSARDRFRVDHLGIVFQIFNLLPWLTALDNTLLPCRFSQQRTARAGTDPEATAKQLLADLGLSDPELLQKPASDLSIGQQQRVAAARALIGAPEVVLADEPTSALDDDAKAAYIRVLLRECAQTGSALIFVSHDRSLEAHFDRTVELASINRVAFAC
jgi:putative ABC transport system ATP-binding protein